MNMRTLLQQSFLKILTYIVGGSLIVIAVVVSLQTIGTRENMAQQIMGSYMESYVHADPNIDAWKATSEFAESDTFTIIVPNNGAKLFKHGKVDEFQKIVKRITKKYYFSIRYGIYYGIGHRDRKANYKIYLSMNAVLLQVFETVLAIAIVGVVGLSFGRRKVIKTALKLALPLERLSDETASGKVKLTVPDGPTEMIELSKNFNALLKKLDNRLLRERQFSSDVSHELRTPLSGIIGHVSLINKHKENHPEIMEESLAFISSESLHMQALIESLLKVSRSEVMYNKKTDIDLSQLLVDFKKNYALKIPQTIRLNLSPTIISGDKVMVKEILLQLVENASKYSSPDSIIILKVRDGALFIIDQGPGIPDADKSEIFERLVRVETSRNSQISGFGLGLSVVKELVKLNDAKITVSDNKPNGAIFIVKFNI